MVFEGLQCFVRGQNSLFLDSYPSSGHLTTNLSSFMLSFLVIRKTSLVSDANKVPKKNNDNIKIMVMTKFNFFPKRLTLFFVVVQTGFNY